MREPIADSSVRVCRRGRAGHFVAAAVALVVVGVSSCKRSTPGALAEQTPPAPAKATSPAVPETVRKLLGRWMRADGGYVLELRNADLSGVLEAGYFNPKSIRVSRAIWMQGATGFQVVVELNDVGYPGATYVLSYDPQADKLVGQYTQPAMQQSFDIAFTRQPR